MKLLRVAPLLKPLQADPRWPRLLTTMGLSNERVVNLSLDITLP